MAKLMVCLDCGRIGARDIVRWTMDGLEGSQMASKLMRRHCRTETWGSGLRAIFVWYGWKQGNLGWGGVGDLECFGGACSSGSASEGGPDY
jgi:hypothetical protein